MDNQDQSKTQSGLQEPVTQSQDEGIKKLSQPVLHQAANEKDSLKQKTHKELYMENVSFQNNMQSQNAKQAYYIPDGLPADLPGDELNGEGGNGKSKGITSIICAVVSLGFLPPIFGIAGIVYGLKARKMGTTTLGTIGIVLSILFMVVGMALSYRFLVIENATGSVMGGFLGSI